MERLLENIENTANLNEYRYRLIAENMLDVITLIDNNNKIKYASPSYQHLLGYEPSEILGRGFVSFLHPDDINKFGNTYHEAVQGKTSGKLECRFRNANGKYLWLEVVWSILFDCAGKFEGAIFCSRDIGERKFSEEMLKDSEQRYRQLVELLPDGVLVVCKGKIVFANKAAKSLLNINNTLGIEGRYYRNIVHPDFYTDISLLIKKIIEGQVASLIDSKYIKENGESLDVEITGTPFKYQGEVAELIVFRDISERKKAEESLEETRKMLFEREKLALIGQMSAGMAHEIRNPLTAIRGFTQLLRIKDYDKAKVNYYLDMIIEEIDRVNSLISEFLQLARPKEPNLKKQAINKVITEFLDLIMSQAIYNSIEVICESEGNLPECLFDKDQIKQVLLNLSKNSIDAMPKGGKLKIVTGYNDAEKQIFIIIEDNGLGIPESELSKLAMPFFSTKEKGTGLGLSISYALIRGHGGKVQVESTEGEGTKFTIYLPVE